MHRKNVSKAGLAGGINETKQIGASYRVSWGSREDRRIRKASRFVRATSEADVLFDSGVTSSFASNSLTGSGALRCTQDSQPCLGHHEMLPGISRFSSCPGIVVDEDAPDAGPPSAARAHKPPG